MRKSSLDSDVHASFSQCSEDVYLIEALRKVRYEVNRLADLSYANHIDTKQSLRDHYKRVLCQHDVIIHHVTKRNWTNLKGPGTDILDFKNK